jgi:hypothetical protein
MPYSAPPPTLSPPSATATSRRSPAKGGWPGSGTAAIMKGLASRASSRAGSRSSVTGCVSTATRPALLKSPSRPRSSTECSTLDARTPSALHDQQWGMGVLFPLPPPCNMLHRGPNPETECSTFDARTLLTSPDHRQGQGNFRRRFAQCNIPRGGPGAPDRLGSGNGGGTFHISASKGGAPRFPVRAAKRTTRGYLVKGNVAEWAAALHHDVMPAGVADVIQGNDPIFGIVPDTVLPFTGGAGVAGKGVIAL